MPVARVSLRDSYPSHIPETVDLPPHWDALRDAARVRTGKHPPDGATEFLGDWGAIPDVSETFPA